MGAAGRKYGVVSKKSWFFKRVQGAGCRVQGAGCRCRQGAGCGVRGVGAGAGCRWQGAEPKVAQPSRLCGVFSLFLLNDRGRVQGASVVCPLCPPCPPCPPCPLCPQCPPRIQSQKCLRVWNECVGLSVWRVVPARPDARMVPEESFAASWRRPSHRTMHRAGGRHRVRQGFAEI